ncbi:TonB-dependent receptor [Steroidobacter agaridevorans]|uniref:TonB-dependent receptor n=1 Tax=Steroidobacter agaridevorans TaxID=2695856 RepID=A0A829YC45_9GAMM|nr:TonB-dependent receptor [Steroidobacter agaridevorans]GFE80513.1 TonB-dependent receptor [Steroidobacter agaridevorans]
MRVSVAAVCLALMGLSGTAESQAAVRKATDIPSQGLGLALQSLAKERSFQLVYVSEEVDALNTQGAVGEFTPEEALARLLAGTGLTFKYLNEHTVTILPVAPSTPERERPVNAESGDQRVPRISRPWIVKNVRLASAASAVMFGVAGGPAAAQSAAAPQDLEEVVVTGIRSSLRQAMEIKRDSDQIVDSIASESLGKFPDTNIAESLQRITGVSIDRSGGEGQGVTVRGFGPEFNTVLLNGRRLASDTGARSFNFDVLPAELISRVDVYKSATALLQEGGIGSAILLHTPRPLELGEFKSILSAKALYEDLSENTTPEVFGMISDTFADGRIGLLVSASYQKRENRSERILTDGYLTAPRDDLKLIASDLAAQGYSADDQFFIPQNLNVSPVDEDRERVNVNATFQYQIADNVRLTVDGMYDKFNVYTQANSLGFFVTPSIITNARFDEHRTATSITQTIEAAVDYTRSERDRPTDIYAGGLNLAWDVNDSVNVSLDSSWSRAKSGGAEGTNVAVVGFRKDIYTLSYGPNGIPSVTGVPSADYVDPSLPVAHFNLRGTGGGPLGGGADLEDEIYEHRIEAQWQPESDLLKRVTVGGYYLQEKQSRDTRLSDNEVLCMYCGYFVGIPDNLLRPFSVGSGYLGGRVSVPSAWQTFDIDPLLAYLESPEAASARDAARNLPPGSTLSDLAKSNGFEIHQRPDSSRVEEEVAALYADASLEGSLAQMPWNLTLGARYVRTETTAFGISQALQDLRNSGDPTLYMTVLGDAVTVSQTNKYNDFLPSLSFRLNVTDDVVLRFAASKTLTRPPLGALSPRLVIGTTRPGNLQASSGNPDLKPFKSKNADLSAEWYYQDNGFITVGVFYKEVQNFLVNTVENRALPIADSDNLFAGDPVFEVSLLDNLESATVKGVEIGAQHSFDYLPGFWQGFGLGANATLVDSGAELNVDDVSQTFALEGLGDSYNVVGFYENGPLEVRVAWNRRERFLRTAVGFGGEPTFVEPYQQIDARASLAISDHFSVFAEGVNLGNEIQHRVGRYDNQILLLEETGRRYTIGVRAEF